MTFSQYFKKAGKDYVETILSFGREEKVPLARIWGEYRQPHLRNIPTAHSRQESEAFQELMSLDFASIWFGTVPLVCLQRVLSMSDEERSMSGHKINVISSISGRISADLEAIRLLICNGYDVQARQILRGVSENIDALGLAYINEQFCEEFVVNQDVDDANVVWYKYISKGKAKKRIYQAIAEFAGTTVSPTWDSHRIAEETVLSAAAHPSFISGFMSLVPDFGETEEGGVSGQIREASLRTLRYCNRRVWEHVIFDVTVASATNDICNRLPALVRGVKTETYKRRCMGVRNVLLKLSLLNWKLEATPPSQQ